MAARTAAGPGSAATAGGTARLSPLALVASARIRLQRLWPKAVYKEEQAQVVVPLPRGADPAHALSDLLGQLVPA